MVIGPHGPHGVVVQDRVTAEKRIDDGPVQIPNQSGWELIVLVIQIRWRSVTDIHVEVCLWVLTVSIMTYVFKMP